MLIRDKEILYRLLLGLAKHFHASTVWLLTQLTQDNVIFIFILQLSSQLQESSEYWADKVRNLSAQLEREKPLSPLR